MKNLSSSNLETKVNRLFRSRMGIETALTYLFFFCPYGPKWSLTCTSIRARWIFSSIKWMLALLISFSTVSSPLVLGRFFTFLPNRVLLKTFFTSRSSPKRRMYNNILFTASSYISYNSAFLGATFLCRLWLKRLFFSEFSFTTCRSVYGFFSSASMSLLRISLRVERALCALKTYLLLRTKLN